jgi:hypothetical protein
MHIGLIPLDERPVNTRYPAMIAQIAGVDVHLPPPDVLSNYRTPARCDALGEWLLDTAPELDALIVSYEMLGYGGLIASRTTDEPASTIIARLDQLREVRRQRPSMPMLGFNLITRISNNDYAAEEAPYWATYGRRIYRLSQLIDQQAQGQPVAEELAALRAEIPTAHLDDFNRRRMRNHTVNLVALQLLADSVFDLLVLSSDDTSPYGLPSREKRWLAEWAEALGLQDERPTTNDEQRMTEGKGRKTEDEKQGSGVRGQGSGFEQPTADYEPLTTAYRRLLMYPGADEVGCALLGRLINEHAGVQPRIAPFYAVPGGEEIVAAYEDGPVRLTVERQVRAVGGVLVEGEGDIWLAVNPPVPHRSEWHPDYADQERAERLPYLQKLVKEVRQRVQAGQPVIVADVAYPNGADPALFDLLRETIDLPKLAAYGGWNTAGNTIGTALAHGCAALIASTESQQQAHETFLLHRYLEDWGYQQIVRRRARDWLLNETGQDQPTQANLAATTEWIEAQLRARLDELPGFAGRYEIVPGSVRLPWGRLFEVDFEVWGREQGTGNREAEHVTRKCNT